MLHEIDIRQGNGYIDETQQTNDQFQAFIAFQNFIRSQVFTQKKRFLFGHFSNDSRVHVINHNSFFLICLLLILF